MVVEGSDLEQNAKGKSEAAEEYQGTLNDGQWTVPQAKVQSWITMPATRVRAHELAMRLRLTLMH